MIMIMVMVMMTMIPTFYNYNDNDGSYVSIVLSKTVIIVSVPKSSIDRYLTYLT